MIAYGILTLLWLAGGLIPLLTKLLILSAFNHSVYYIKPHVCYPPATFSCTVPLILANNGNKHRNLMRYKIIKHTKVYLPLHVFDEINQYYSTCQSLLFLCLSWEKLEFRTHKHCSQVFTLHWPKLGLSKVALCWLQRWKKASGFLNLNFIQNCETKKVHLVFDFSMILIIVSTFPFIQGSTVAHSYVICCRIWRSKFKPQQERLFILPKKNNFGCLIIEILWITENRPPDAPHIVKIPFPLLCCCW